jgi:hypothetical protein
MNAYIPDNFANLSLEDLTDLLQTFAENRSELKHKLSLFAKCPGKRAPYGVDTQNDLKRKLYAVENAIDNIHHQLSTYRKSKRFCS